MKTRLTPAAFVFAAIALSTQSSAPESGRVELQAELIDPDSAEAVEIRRTGEAATNWLGARLFHEVKTTVAKNGAEAAVALCHLKSVAAGGQPVPGMPAIKASKLTSLRLLNAANAPDAAEQLVLEHVDRQIQRGDPPPGVLVQRITAPDGTTEWRVYRPLVLLPACAVCHGDPATQSPALQTLLLERAPAQVATGYEPGDWRGLLRVTVAAPKPR